MQDNEELYREYSTQVYKFVFSFCHNHLLAEEITQETFYRAVKSIHKYDGTCKVYVWLCQIAKHVWYQELDKQHKRKSYELDDPPVSSANSTESQFILAQDKMELFKQLHLLDPNTKEVLYLRLTGEFSFREIGEILGRDETWARVTFYRGKQKLMKGRST
ncbi:RNA polymerase subunit sigma [Paenibacillus sp. VTT E-133280]|jgi:RNA polymerase sigma-70 factor (ECF subfamily)|uniref:RNA polymerase sigma factor n=1 Tax=Paenibacillus TaxID=44249 RepID=UPI000BA03847|nr:sigma-70 family RNA polymerase sigma factor [Paenibacillus sp. VTT E-133280]OZQ60423.1 RNA polymerase subunit sigma [Paenibacillus sp. VTT E-133280]